MQNMQSFLDRSRSIGVFVPRKDPMQRRIILGISLLFLLSACKPPVTTTVQSGTVTLPNDEQLKTVLSDFEKYAVQAQRDWKVPGMAIAITKKDKVLFSKGFGLTKAGGTAVNEKTVFQIGSATKAFTAMLVAMQVAEGKLAWSDTLTSRLPEFKMYDDRVTQEFKLSDLMAQHSGLAPYSGDSLFMFGNGSRAEVVEKIRLLKPASSFRSEFAYVNNLFVTAGVLVEKVSGKTWEDNLQKRILDPLGMTETTYSFPSFRSAPNVAWDHCYDFDHAVTGSVPSPAIMSMDWPLHNWLDVAGPAGAINSNVVDMVKWVQLQLGKGARNDVRLLGESELAYLQAPKTPLPGGSGLQSFYCDGWVYSEGRPYSYVWHDGATTGAHSMVAFMPEAGVGIVILTNLAGHQAPEALMNKFFDMYCGMPAKDWNAIRLEAFKKGVEPTVLDYGNPALPLPAYVGTYRNSYYGDIEVVLNGDSLKAYLGKRRIEGSLKSLGENQFALGLDVLGIGLCSFEGTGGSISKLSVNGMKDAVEDSFLKL